MKNERPGIALIICAPSGAGKTTLVQRLIKEFSRFGYSISYTTRAPRQGEVNGTDYHFVSEEEFEKLRDQNFFAEWARVHDNYYGTPLEGVKELLAQGKDVLLDIDIQGARQVKDRLPGRYVFILPPSRQELERRLSGRGTDNAQVILKRMNNALAEIANANFFDTLIINDDLDQAYDELRAAYVCETLAPRCMESFLTDLVAQWKEHGTG